jgi:sulfur-oxidizing protein SoxX
MPNRASFLLAAMAAGILASTAVPGFAADEAAKKEVTGRDLVFDRAKGNCLACHAIPGDPKAESPGNIAPPLVMMNQRYPDSAKLRAQIWDATKANPRTAMPPFGKHKILSESEIDKVVEYIHSL